MKRRVCPPCQRKNHQGCASRQSCECTICEQLVWSEPPRARHARPTWLPPEEGLAEIRRRRISCRVFVFDDAPAANHAGRRARSGNVPGLGTGEWEAHTSTLDDGRVGLWLRYVGPELEEEAP